MIKKLLSLLILTPTLFFDGFGTAKYTTPTIITLDSKIEDKQLRSLKISTPIGTVTTKPADFNKIIFNQDQTIFYLGAKNAILADGDTNLKKYSISRVLLDSQYPLIEGVMPENLSGGGANPLYGAKILNLAQFKTTSLVVNAPDASGTNQILHLIENPNQAGDKIDSTTTINDAGGATINEIKSITCSSDYIFAAVSATGVAWDNNETSGANRGIAVIYPDSSQNTTVLKILDATNINQGTEGNRAAKLSLLTSDSVLSFRKTDLGINGAVFNQEQSSNTVVDMVWNSDIQRLFVATTDLSRDDNTKEGGILSIAVGRIEKDASTGKTALLFSPIIASPSTISENVATHIIGFYYNATKTDASKVSTKKIRLMHTSTNKYYLITNSTLVEKTITINGGVTVYGTDGVFAFPLNTTSSDTKVLGTLTEVPDVSDQRFTVGVNTVETTIKDSDAITDIFVHGDSVYMCLGSRTDPQSLGIFKSSAIFDNNGYIIGWTLWQRVMGSVQKVWGGSVDHTTNNFYFLASQTPTVTDATSNTACITQWNTTELANSNSPKTPNTDYNLSSILSQIFPQSEGGIFQIFDFDDQTDGFAKGQFSMMVIIGCNKIAIVQTSQLVDGVLQPITNFELDKNIKVFNDDLLKNISPLCCAEVSRMTSTNSGWLFIGGLGGIVVLNKSGKGWDSQVGLSNVTDLDGFSFKQLTPKTMSFTNFRKIICQNSIAWIETKDALGSFDISSNTFITGNNVDEKAIDAKLPTTTKFSDFLVIPGTNTFLILGTTSGLYAFKVGESSAYKIGNNTDPAVHLNYISMQRGGISSAGNLYVLFSNFINEVGKVYRYTVNGIVTSVQNLVQAIKPDSTSDGLFVDLHYYRGNFVTDGSFGYSELAKGLGYNDMFHLYEITTDANEQNYEMTLDININPNINWYIGVATMNSASGSILIPGDWGLIVNE